MIEVDQSMKIDDEQRAAKLVEACKKIREQVGRIVVGQEDVVEQLLMASKIIVAAYSTFVVSLEVRAFRPSSSSTAASTNISPPPGSIFELVGS